MAATPLDLSKDLAKDLAKDRGAALRLSPVSRETSERLDQFVTTLLAWNARINLIAAGTVPTLWTRHVADSLQLVDLAPPAARVWVDLGSGGGFPGIVLACALAERPGACVHLVESNSKKAAFLREVVRITDIPAIVHAERIEKFAKTFVAPVDVITARALAPLKLLLEHSVRWLAAGTLGLFPKGRDVNAELTDAAKSWNIKVNLAPSRTDPNGRIVIVRALQPRTLLSDHPMREG